MDGCARPAWARVPVGGRAPLHAVARCSIARLPHLSWPPPAWRGSRGRWGTDTRTAWTDCTQAARALQPKHPHSSCCCSCRGRAPSARPAATALCAGCACCAGRGAAQRRRHQPAQVCQHTGCADPRPQPASAGSRGPSACPPARRARRSAAGPPPRRCAGRASAAAHQSPCDAAIEEAEHREQRAPAHHAHLRILRLWRCGGGGGRVGARHAEIPKLHAPGATGVPQVPAEKLLKLLQAARLHEKIQQTTAQRHPARFQRPQQPQPAPRIERPVSMRSTWLTCRYAPDLQPNCHLPQSL